MVITKITPELLRSWPLPAADEGDKESRGRVLVIGGDRQLPGAILLTAIAALRAGAGKVQIGTIESIAVQIGVAMPEARVFALPETSGGAIDPRFVDVLAEWAPKAAAVVIGPGMVDERSASQLARQLLDSINGPTWVIDAAAIACLADHPRAVASLNRRAVLTPHAGEMAQLLSCSKEDVAAYPLEKARLAADTLGVVIVMKGSTTYVAEPHGRTFANTAGNAGLATSGSGDVLSGIIAGIAARGANAVQAAVWGVSLHAHAGDRLAQNIGPIGYLAREIPDHVPGLLRDLA